MREEQEHWETWRDSRKGCVKRIEIWVRVIDYKHFLEIYFTRGSSSYRPRQWSFIELRIVPTYWKDKDSLTISTKVLLSNSRITWIARYCQLLNQNNPSTKFKRLHFEHTLKRKQQPGALQQTLALHIVMHCYLHRIINNAQRPG
jgi:hypothetical protein